MKLTLGFSPCPNDTFIFDALVNQKIDTKGLEFEVQLADVQTLNQWAIEGRLDISKISYGVLPLILSNYAVLRSGGALGRGVGPLLVTAAAANADRLIQNVQAPVAIPGQHTTANFLFTQAYPLHTNKKYMRFDAIEDWVLQHPNSMGVIIHENRFTYAQKGLQKLADLGELWESFTGYPIPLGGIVANRKLDSHIALLVDSLIRQSVAYAFAHGHTISQYVKDHAQEMDESIMRQHIDLYVNDFSADIGKSGEAAIAALLHALAPAKPIDNVFIH